MDLLPVETPLSISNIIPVIDGGYNLVAVTTLLLWDILITLPREEKYIWSYPSRCNWITIFYIITRYVPFIANVACLISLYILQLGDLLGTLFFKMTDPGTEHFTRIIRILIISYIVLWFISLICTEILFVKRVVALHGGSRILSRILAGLLVCEIIFAILLSTPGLTPIVSVHHSSDLGTQTPHLVLSSFRTYLPLPEIGFQAILVMLVINVIISDWRAISDGNFVSVVVRDGIWSYACNLCGLLVIYFQPTWLSGPLGLPNSLWSFASLSITSTRLILNLRAVAAKQSGVNNTSSAGPINHGVGIRLTFLQGIQSFLASGAPENDEFAASYHYSEFGHDSDSDNDD